MFVQFPVRQKDGTLMTDKKKYIERIPAGQALKGKVLFRDKTRDLALVQLDRLPPGHPGPPPGQDERPRWARRVINIGNPGAVDRTFSTTQGDGPRRSGSRDLAVGGGGEIMRDQGQDGHGHEPDQPGRLGRPADRQAGLPGRR